MSRTSLRSTRLLSWRYLRWAIAIPTLPIAWWACTSHPLTQPVPQPEQQTDIYISVAPIRELDLVFAVDNSPSMAPKVTKMNQQFTKLIDALKDPNDGSLPDLRVALIDSDLGSGGAWTTGACGPSPKTNTVYGDLGRFQMIGAGDCGVTDDKLWLEHTKGRPVNYTGNINSVFACLASNLGTMGCGVEHQLQSVNFGIVPGVPGNEAQLEMLRPSAYLGIVFLTDEDDCSAATNDAMFGDKDELKNEAPSLRCATRAHACNGRNLADKADDLPGYPTERAFTAPFESCTARTTSYCSNETDGAGAQGTNTAVWTECVPLKSIQNMADAIKGRKGEPDQQILVAGIFGWPLKGQNLQYKIDKVPNPQEQDKAHPEIWDLWPICYDPDHMPKGAGFDKDAAGWGAPPGLRMSAYIDQFGENGLKYSICERDFSEAMNGIGSAIAKKLQNLCVDYKLIDTQEDTPGVQADCRVVYRHAKTVDGKVQYTEDPQSMPQCEPGVPDDGQPRTPCWKLVTDKSKCPKNGQLINVVDPEVKQNPLTPGTKVGMQCRTCIETTGDVVPLEGCDYELN